MLIPAVACCFQPVACCFQLLHAASSCGRKHSEYSLIVQPPRCHLLQSFQNDADGSKEQWRKNLREKLMGMTEKEADGTLLVAEIENKAYLSLRGGGDGGGQSEQTEQPRKARPAARHDSGSKGARGNMLSAIGGGKSSKGAP